MMSHNNEGRTVEDCGQVMDYLRTVLRAEHGGTCLMWVDPSLTDPFKEDPRTAGRLVRIPIRHPRFDPSLASYFVPIDLACSGDRDLLNQSIEIAWEAWHLQTLRLRRGHPIAGWIVTRNSPQAVAGYWTRNCYLHLRGNLTKLLRFHDPAVRQWLWRSLTKQQRCALLGRVESIFSIGRGHCILSHSTDGQTSVDYGRFELEERQWFEVEQYATVHSARLLFADAGCDDELLASCWERDAIDALQYANAYGISVESDRELFALHALQFGRDFHLSGRLSAVWEKTRAGEFYGNAIQEILGCAPTRLDLQIRT